jgi:putative DNA primase/helicase
MAKYNFQDIPYELQKLNQWVLWSYEEKKDGKFTKVPKQVDGKNASTIYNRTWSSFSAVRHVMEEYGFEGIGFVFNENDDFIGIDLDKCVDEKGKISEFAQKIINQLDSYTEFSPSGRGIHIIIRGSLPSSFDKGMRNDELGIEIYSQKRFFTFTGDRENENEVFDRTDEINELIEEIFDFSEIQDEYEYTIDVNSEYDENSTSAIWERMFNSKNGEVIKKMFEGEWTTNNDHSATDLSLCNFLAFWCDKNFPMIDHMFRQTGLMRDKWDENRGDITYGEDCIRKAILGTKDTINGKKDKLITIKEADAAPSKFPHTELGNAEWFAHEYNEKVLYSNQYGWLVWNKKKWEIDETSKVEVLSTKLLKKLLIYKKETGTEEEIAAIKLENKESYKWGMASQSRRVITNTISLSKALLPVKMEQLDSNKYLMNCQNGILDLKTGTLLPHASHHMMTKIADIGYEREAKCPTWDIFLSTVFVDEKGNTDHDLIKYVQKLIGYSMTGDVSEQSMYFLYGGGKNGKSTFINTIKDLLGDYSRQTNKETFISKETNGSANSDIARLAGSRFVSAVESNEGEKLDESIVKQITGGESIIARFLHKDYFEFSPEFKVFFTTNHKPIVKGTDEGIWRRIKLIPFLAYIPTEKQDLQLPVKLKEEVSGILNWMVEGCLLWQKEGLKDANSVSRSNQDYRSEMDISLPFLTECCDINPLAKVELKELYNEYQFFCTENDEYKLKKRTFTREMEGKGYKKEIGAGNKTFMLGLGLKKEIVNKRNKYQPQSTKKWN